MTPNQSELREAVARLLWDRWALDHEIEWRDAGGVQSEYQGVADAVLALIADRAPQVAGGDWVLVPREPTEEEIRAGVDFALNGIRPIGFGVKEYVRGIRAAMLAAAPTASAVEGGEDRESWDGNYARDLEISEELEALDRAEAKVSVDSMRSALLALAEARQRGADNGPYLAVLAYWTEAHADQIDRALRPAGGERENPNG